MFLSYLILKQTSAFDPSSGFEASDKHFTALWEGHRIGSVYWLSDAWVWAIEIVGIGGFAHGKAKTFAEAESALTARWHEREATLGIDFIIRAIALGHKVDSDIPLRN